MTEHAPDQVGRKASRAAHLAVVTVLALIMAVLIHSLILYYRPAPLDSDECAEALMAMDIVSNPRFIVGWYGQNYMGSHEIYWLAALCPQGNWSPVSVRIAVFLLFVAQVALIGYLAHRYAGHRGAICALAVLCMLSPFAYAWVTRARSYQVMPLLLLLALAVETGLPDRSPDGSTEGYPRWLVVGVLAGSAVWANEIAVAMLLPVLALAVTQKRVLLARLAFLTLGSIIGLLPRIIYNVRNNFAQAQFLGAKLTQVDRAELEAHGLKDALLYHSFDTITIENIWASCAAGLGYPLMLLTAVLALSLLLPAVRTRVFQGQTGKLCAGLGASIVIGAAISWCPRYAAVMIPYIALLTGIVAASVFRGVRRLGWVLMVLLLIGVAISLTTVMRASTGGKITPGERLVDFLVGRRQECGISGYDTAHKIMFYSRRAIEVSVMGEPSFHPRLNEVERRVATEGALFVVYDVDDSLSRAGRLKDHLGREGIDYFHEVSEGRFGVYYGFSAPVYPGQYLGEEDMFLFEHYSPDQPRRASQERANVLF